VAAWASTLRRLGTSTPLFPIPTKRGALAGNPPKALSRQAIGGILKHAATHAGAVYRRYHPLRLTGQTLGTLQVYLDKLDAWKNNPTTFIRI